MSIKKDIFAPLASGLGATRRAAMLLLVMMLTATTAWATDKTLSGSESYTAQNGDVLTGSTSGTVTIANDAKITLSDATITGGIVCAGMAEITLVGTNSVSNTLHSSAGIQIGSSGTTLTIKGNGSLNATGGSASAGIGLGRTWDANATGGSVVIEGGTVTASGGNGIGTGTVGNSMTAHMDGIIIKGGTVNARLGKGTINYGSSVTIGTLKIYDGIEKVDASAITESVTYMHVDGNTETDVTASASTYFTITEDGDRRVIVPKDNTDYTITIADGIEHGTLTGAATAKYMEKVTITATPALGYRFSRLVVKDAQNNDVESTGNSFFMPKSNVTVSAEFEQGVHGTTEFAWGYYGSGGFVNEATIYDGVTTVNLQQKGKSYNILKYEGNTYYKFLLDNDTHEANIPYAGGTGEFYEFGNPTNFNVPYDGETGFYDITMTDVGNGKWSVSILKTVAVMDAVPDQTYTGSAITPEPTVIAGSLNLTKGTHYEYSYMNNTDEGTQAKVTVNFLGDYTWLGSVERTFNIICEHTITYDLAGGTVATENPTTYTIVSGDITLTTPTREGYTFTGWTGTDLTEPTMTVTIASGSTGDRQYTATWTMTWANVKAALQAGQSVTLANDVTRVNSECIEPSGTVTLDLNGYTIDGGRTQTNPLFRIGDGVSLTITDSQTGGNLCNAGQNATVSVNEGGSLTLAGGTINAQASGVIMWGGNFNMTGGIITGGSSNGVYLNGDNVSFTMTGGTITGNETGVEISHNPSDNKVPTFTVSGNVNITGNTDEDVNMYYDYQSSTLNPIHIGGALNEAARIGINISDAAASVITGNVVMVFTDGLKDKGTKQNFVLNGRAGLALATTESGEIALGAIYTLTLPSPATVSGYTAEQDAPVGSVAYKVPCGDVVTINYTGAVTEGKSVRFTIPNGTITYLGSTDGQGKCITFTMPGSNATISKDADEQDYAFANITLKERFENGASAGLHAIFDGSSLATISIPTAISVTGVTLNRTFTPGKPATLMLPFNGNEAYGGADVNGAAIYTFTGVALNETTQKWEATMTELDKGNAYHFGALVANTPYIVVPTASSITLTNGGTLCTAEGGGQETKPSGSNWTFKGTYSYMKWTTDTSDPDYNAERADEIGKAYGFAGKEKTDIEVGDFVRVASGAKIRPMGCYLLWSDTQNAARRMTRGAADSELPQRITVRLVSSNGETTAIGELDTKTGEISMDGWWTLDGIKLSGKPSSKGIYINNGKKIVIK